MKEVFPEKIWRLYDSATKTLYDNLPESKVATMISALGQHQMPHWFIAEENDLDWTPLYKCYKNFGGDPAKAQTPGPSNFDFIKIKLSERRRGSRPMARVKLIITIGLKTYETYTSDVSASTIKLEAKFKNRVYGIFDVTLLTEDGPLELRCSAIFEPGFEHWNRLNISPNYNFKDYTNFLEKVA